MKNRMLFFTLLTTFYISFNYSQDEGSHKDAFNLINVWLEAQAAYENIPAIMGVVVKDQDILWSRAIGKSNVEENITSNVNTACSICSISKVFTATAIMKLVDEGKLSLKDKVKDILPYYTIHQKYPENGAMTIKSLLTHSSGLQRDTGHAYWSGPDFPFPSKKELIDGMLKMKTINPVDSKVGYSNLGYALLGLIIEEVSGISYKEYMENEIFRPLGMNDSFVEMQKALYGNKHAIGYTAVNRNGKRKKSSFYQTRAMQPAAGVSTSVSDLAKFISWQFRLMDGSTNELLSPKSIRRMHSVQFTGENNRNQRGFGYAVFTDSNNKMWATHGGICPGYVSFLKMDTTDKMGYSIIINANGEKALRYVNGIIDILKRQEGTAKSVENDLDLTEYAGFYNLNPWNSEYYIGPWGNGLVALYLPTESMEYSLYFYQHKSGDTFQLLNDSKEPTAEELTFYRNENGQVEKVKNEGNYHFKQ
nr:serine hydrolase domain-containing protein [uncultured Allomuricauda sp.]